MPVQYSSRPLPSKAMDALLVVDMQNDFLLPIGSLCISGGETIVERMNEIARRRSFAVQVLTQDWHPPTHQSFQSYGGPWPVHCVEGTEGAALHVQLDTRPYECIIRKGTREQYDSYSAFEDLGHQVTGLAGLLRGRSITRVWIAGVAGDYCVKSTAEDALKEGFEVFLIEDLTKAVDPEKFMRKDREALQRLGVKFVNSEDIFSSSSVSEPNTKTE